MAYKDLLVVVDSEPQARDRMVLAADIAQRFEAHLVGLYVTEGLETQRRYNRPCSDLIDEARAQFDNIAGGRPFTTEWRSASGFATDVVAVQARYADLTIVGQLDPQSEWASILCPRPEDVAMTAGRPILIVPYIGRSQPIGNNVLVGWDASREAARAVSDAMPLLATAASVTVISIDPQPSWEGHGAVAGADIAGHLARHGVTVQVERTVSAGVDVGDVLLSRASDLGADMLVMGAYGHSRVRELILGGMTRAILDTMTVPTLMAH